MKAGVPTVSIGPFDANGAGLDHKPNPLLSDKIVKAAFTQAPTDEPDLQDAGAGEYFALHVDKVIASALPALADVRPQMVQAYISQTFMTALRAKVDGLTARMKKGETIDQVAASVGGHVVHQQGLQRLKVLEGIRGRVSQDFVRDIFAASETAAHDQIKVTLNLPLARQAIGVDPNFGTSNTGKTGAKSPAKAK